MDSILYKDIFDIWHNNYERKNWDTNEFKPIFKRYIGVKNPNTYNDLLATLDLKIKDNRNKIILFDGEIPLNANFELINSINNELNTMDVLNIGTQDIRVFENNEINKVFLSALSHVVKVATENECFINSSTRNDFITKIIIWSNCYIKRVTYDGDIVPKCIYYGNITKHEAYFLLLCYLMSFDVLYLNPLKDSDAFKKNCFEEVSQIIKESNILEIETFWKKVNNGKAINKIETATKKIKEDVYNQLLEDTGVYRPWQFRGFKTKALFIDCILEDLKVKFNEPAKIREGFNTELQKKVVTIPNFFFKIDGIYKDFAKYQELVHLLISSDNTLVINSLDFFNWTFNNIYELIFCRLSNGTFNFEDLMKTEENNISKYNIYTKQIIIEKLNDFILEDYTILERKLSEKDLLKLVYMILNIPDDVARLIDNFDFPNKVPKIIIFLEKQTRLLDEHIIFLCYLNTLGIDIVILNPSGLSSVNTVINKIRFNEIRLDTMDYEITLEKAKKKLKYNVLNKIRELIGRD